MKALAKKILDGSHNEQKESDWLNTITYQNLPSHQKSGFRAKHLKHVPLRVLEERELKKKMKEEEFKKKQVQIQEKIKEQ